MHRRNTLLAPTRHTLSRRHPPPSLAHRAKGQQKKGQARMRRYDELVAQQAAYVKAAQVGRGWA